MISENHSYDYDVAIVGAGPGGAEAARELGRNGKKVVLIEANEIGGTCLNRGCIPAKTMLYMAEAYRNLEKIKDYGVKVDMDTLKIDYDEVIDRRGKIIEKLKKGLRFVLNKDGVILKEAFATMVDQHTIELDNGESLTSEFIILASGGKSRRFPGFLEDDPRFLTSDNIFELNEFPKSMVIVGAGPVGTEFASFFHTFGTEIHVVEMKDYFLTAYDRKLGDELVKCFDRDGIHCHTGTSVESVDSSGELLKVKLANGTEIEAEYILSAIGVTVNTDYCNNDRCAMLVNKSGRLEVNEEYQTNFSNVYAIGDLIGKSGSAYGAEREAKRVAYALLGHDLNLVPVNYPNFPDVVFTHPEVASCGASDTELEEKGIQFDTKSVQFLVNSKANIKGETRGTIWMYVQKDTGRILGVHIIGHEATEIIHQVPPMLEANMTTQDIMRAVWGHPVMAEIIKDVVTLG